MANYRGSNKAVPCDDRACQRGITTGKHCRRICITGDITAMTHLGRNRVKYHVVLRTWGSTGKCHNTLIPYLEPRKHAKICCPFRRTFFFWEQHLFETALFLTANTFQISDGWTDFSEIDILDGFYCSNWPSWLQRVLLDPICALLGCMVLSISSFWMFLIGWVPNIIVRGTFQHS